MDKAINIAFVGYTNGYIQYQKATEIEKINERVSQNGTLGNSMIAMTVSSEVASATVDADNCDDHNDVANYDYNDDDDDGNVDGYDYLYRNRVNPINSNAPTPHPHPAAVAGSRKGITMADIGLNVDDMVDVDEDGDDDNDDGSESFGSMETLSDNVAVWVGGEKHWVAGVDANTTCTDLIRALLNYQNAQQIEEQTQKQQQQEQEHNQHKQRHNKNHHGYQQLLFNNNNGNVNNNKAITTTTNGVNINITTNTHINQSTLVKTSTNTKEKCSSSLMPASGELTIGGCFSTATTNASTKATATLTANATANATANGKSSHITALTVPATNNDISIADNRLMYAYDYVIVKQHRHYEEYLDGEAKVFDILPTPSDGSTRKECELLLRRLLPASADANNISNTIQTNSYNNNNKNNNNINNSTSGLIEMSTPPTLHHHHSHHHHHRSSPSFNLNTQVSSLLSTDKDSGMGSPVGSSRSARLRRRKYKSASSTISWLAQSNTLHPRISQRAVAAFSGLKNAATLATSATVTTIGAHNANSRNEKHIPTLIEQRMIRGGDGNVMDMDAFDMDGLVGGEGGGVSANERLLKIILAQDETIHHQLVLLREKERQISKIEEEKHRVRERELGKNYLLETYLNGLDEVAVEPNNSEPCTDIVLADSLLNEFNEVRDAKTNEGGGHVVVHGDGDGDDNGDSIDDVEIYIDEPYQRDGRTTSARRTETATTTTTTKTTANKYMGTTKVKGIQIDSHHSKKMKGDFTGSGGDVVVGGGFYKGGILISEKHNKANELASAKKRQENENNEIDAQIFWLEKIYALNKQLQREEETLLKLHAKIRKHQVKRAYQTKREVLQEIEKLDAELTLQCCDIRVVESKLHASNEQLKQKLSVLERLSQEFLETMHASTDGGSGGAGDAAAANDNAIGEVNVSVATPAMTTLTDGQRTVNRIPEINNNDEHDNVEVARQLIATTKVARQELHAKQMSVVVGLTTQQSCQLHLTGGVVADDMPVGQKMRQDTEMQEIYLPHAKQLDEQVLHGNLNDLNEKTKMTRMMIRNTAAVSTTTTTITSAPTTPNCATVAACHASKPTMATATSCSASMSTMPSIKATTITATEITKTTPTTTITASSTIACRSNMPTTTTTTTFQNIPINYNNLQQCVVTNDVHVDSEAHLPAVGETQSNYPISCINHAATSQHETIQTVAAAADLECDMTAVGGLVSEQTKQTLPVVYSTSQAPVSSSAATMINHQQQQQQQQQLQLTSQKQCKHINASGNSSISDINNNNDNKNLLPPSHAAHSKILQKKLFGPKSLKQMLPPPTMPTQQKVILTTPTIPHSPQTSATTTMTPTQFGLTAGYCSMGLRSTTPKPTTTTPTTTTQLCSPAMLPIPISEQRSNVDITQLGTLV